MAVFHSRTPSSHPGSAVFVIADQGASQCPGHTTETAESASPCLEGPNLRVKASIGGTRTENNRGGSWNVPYSTEYVHKRS